MKIIYIVLLSLFTLPLFGQAGISTSYQNVNPKLWKSWTGQQNLFDDSYEFGIDYWFRLKNYRVEFTPQVYHYRWSTETPNYVGYRLRSTGFAANTNLYIFDFIGDCDCPTFSKDGTFISKGFHLSLAPVVEYLSLENFTDIAGEGTEDKMVVYGIKVGAGLDIGINDLLTLTPFVRYKYMPSVDWEGLAAINIDENAEYETANLGFLQFGVRLGLRPDYVREQNKYRFR